MSLFLYSPQLDTLAKNRKITSLLSALKFMKKKNRARGSRLSCVKFVKIDKNRAITTFLSRLKFVKIHKIRGRRLVLSGPKFANIARNLKEIMENQNSSSKFTPFGSQIR